MVTFFKFYRTSYNPSGINLMWDLKILYTPVKESSKSCNKLEEISIASIQKKTYKRLENLVLFLKSDKTVNLLEKLQPSVITF